MSKQREALWVKLDKDAYQLRPDLCAPGIEVYLEPRNRGIFGPAKQWQIVINQKGELRYVPRPSARQTRWVALQTAKLWGRYWRTGKYKWEAEIRPWVEVSAQGAST